MNIGQPIKGSMSTVKFKIFLETTAFCVFPVKTPEVRNCILSIWPSCLLFTAYAENERIARVIIIFETAEPQKCYHVI